MVRVGFIGTGQMGRPMAERLLAAGFALTVHDHRPEAARLLLAQGARWAETPAGAAAGAERVITMLPSSAEVEAVILGPDGVLEQLAPGAIVLDMSSADPASTHRLAERVAERGGIMLDAPVSGGVKGAREGRLAIMVGGPLDAFEVCRPLLAAMGAKLFHVGGHGTGHAMKAVNNACSAAGLLITAEAVAVAVKAGIDPARAVEILQAGTGRSHASDYKFPEFVLTGRFDAGFALGLLVKDLDCYTRLAREVGVPSLVGGTVAELYRLAVSLGMAAEDHTAIVRLIERWAGIELRGQSGTEGAESDGRLPDAPGPR
ncbi:MAG: NAD(P)-dependent oxidoreductase [Candidatus Rokubacteria bacterium]|nr:NAD(P)-dependent oxidoreductase [Candidatus Rokubacteria bacterium]